MSGTSASAREPLALLGSEVGEPAVGDDDALRQPGGPGRVDRCTRRCRACSGPVRSASVTGAAGLRRRSAVAKSGRRARSHGTVSGSRSRCAAVVRPRCRTGIGEHVLDALGRVVRVDRHERRTGLGDRPHGEHRLDRARNAERHERLRARAAGDQHAGQPVRPLVELAVASTSRPSNDSAMRVRIQRGRVREDLRQRPGGAAGRPRTGASSARSASVSSVHVRPAVSVPVERRRRAPAARRSAIVVDRVSRRRRSGRYSNFRCSRASTDATRPAGSGRQSSPSMPVTRMPAMSVCSRQPGAVDRVRLEHGQRVEHAPPARRRAGSRSRPEVVVVEQRGLLGLHAVEQLRQRLARVERDPDGHGVDEQPDHRLDAGAAAAGGRRRWRRTPRRRGRSSVPSTIPQAAWTRVLRVSPRSRAQVAQAGSVCSADRSKRDLARRRRTRARPASGGASSVGSVDAGEGACPGVARSRRGPGGSATPGSRGRRGRAAAAARRRRWRTGSAGPGSAAASTSRRAGCGGWSPPAGSRSRRSRDQREPEQRRRGHVERGDPVRGQRVASTSRSRSVVVEADRSTSATAAATRRRIDLHGVAARSSRRTRPAGSGAGPAGPARRGAVGRGSTVAAQFEAQLHQVASTRGVGELRRGTAGRTAAATAARRRSGPGTGSRAGRSRPGRRSTRSRSDGVSPPAPGRARARPSAVERLHPQLGELARPRSAVSTPGRERPRGAQPGAVARVDGDGVDVDDGRDRACRSSACRRVLVSVDRQPARRARRSGVGRPAGRGS